MSAIFWICANSTTQCKKTPVMQFIAITTFYHGHALTKTADYNKMPNCRIYTLLKISINVWTERILDEFNGKLLKQRRRLRFDERRTLVRSTALCKRH